MNSWWPLESSLQKVWMVVSKRRKKRKVKPLLDGIWIRVLLTAFLDEKECRCFTTGPETGSCLV